MNKFYILEIEKDVVMYCTTCYAKNKDSVKRTSIYKTCLINKSFNSILKIVDSIDFVD